MIGKSRRPIKHRMIWIGVRLALLTVGIGLAFLMAEIGCRLADIGSDQFLRQDPVLGVRFIAGKSGVNQGECYRVDISINSDGWRSPDASATNPEGCYRVLVLGDSFMAGLQVGDDETFARVLGHTLNRQELPQSVEVINFGVPSFGTDQEYLSLREYGAGFRPDLVLLAFYAQNDVLNNYAALERRGSEYPKPFFDVDNGELVEIPFSDPTPAVIALSRRVAAHFRIYPLVRNSLLRIPIAHQLLYKLGIVGIVPRSEQVAGPPEATVLRWPDRWKKQTEVYRREYPSEWIHAWSITEKILVKIRDEAELANAGFLLVGISDPVAVLPESLRAGLLQEGGDNSLNVDKPTELLRSLARENQIDFLSLVPAFRKVIGDSEEELEKYYLRCDGHWTPAGHRLAAELTAPSIAERITNPKR